MKHHTRTLLLILLALVLTLSACSGSGNEKISDNYNLKWSDVKSYNIVANIIKDSVQTQGNGNVTFETQLENGKTMRFVGEKISVQDGTLVFEPGSRLLALDAIGRICAMKPSVSDLGSPGNWITFSGGYTFTDSVSVDNAEDLFNIWGFGTALEIYSDPNNSGMSLMDFQPNFICVRMDASNETACSLSELTIYYDEATFNTPIRMMALDSSMYGTYLTGDTYDAGKEQYSLENMIYDFYLLAIPDVANEIEVYDPEPIAEEIMPRSLLGFDSNRFTIGALKDAEGNELDKQTGKVSVGSTIEVTLGKYTMDVQLPVLDAYTDAENLHALTPFNNASATGEVNSLVIPVYWQDQPDKATEEVLQALYAKLGRVSDLNGNVKDYSDQLTEQFSLSGYYDIASYGNYKLTSHVTDWFAAPFNFTDEMEDMQVLDGILEDAVSEWLTKTYPNKDWSQFDADCDGFFDSVILFNVGEDNDDNLTMGSYSYAVQVSPGYTGEGAGTAQKPVIKNYISMNVSFLKDGNTLIHEYAHNFGLIDYYDVTYNGISALGGYDMQDSGMGDWNAYSKYAVGWVKPEIVESLTDGESREFTIGSFAKTGNCIAIPARGETLDSPFAEYILIDLFTPDGVNEYDAPQMGLTNAGVRIYHVDSVMEKRILTGQSGTQYPIGTAHYVNSYNDDGKYHLSLVQAGGKNTFTNLENLRVQLSGDDLFRQGDVFTTDKYTEFFDDGLFHDGSKFGYTVEIVSLDTDAAGEYSAVIRITAK